MRFYIVTVIANCKYVVEMYTSIKNMVNAMKSNEIRLRYLESEYGCA